MPQGDKVPECHDTASAENEYAMDDGTAAIEREQEDNTISEQGVREDEVRVVANDADGSDII